MKLNWKEIFFRNDTNLVYIEEFKHYTFNEQKDHIAYVQSE
jgi:hypothetical protein